MPYRNERYRRRKQKRTAIIGIVVAALLIEIVVVIVLFVSRLLRSPQHARPYQPANRARRHRNTRAGGYLCAG